MKYHRIFCPLWMGAGQHTQVPVGARAIQAALGGAALEIPVAEIANLKKTNLIKAKPEILDVQKALQNQLKPDARVALLGGDCSSDFALLAHLGKVYGADVAILWLDTHADLNTAASSPSGHFHGMVLRASLGGCDTDFAALLPKPLLPQQVFLAGARDFDPSELEFIQQHNIHISSVEDLRDNVAHLAVAVAAAGFKKVHVHLDVDVLDISSFRSSGFSSQGGLHTREVLTMIESIRANFELVSFAVTEYAPAYENDDLETVLQLIKALEGV